MTFLEAGRLSDRVMRGSRGGPVGSRVITRTIGGSVKQKFNRSYPLHRWDLSYGIKTKEDFEAIRSAFYVLMFGPYSGMRAKDWSDFECDQTNSAVTLISGTTYQLQRAYTFGGVTLKRDITKPVAGKVAVYNAIGVLLASSVDTTTGIVTVPSGTPAKWVGEFDVPVFFSDDAMDTIEITGLHHDMQGLPSITVEELPL